MRVLIVDDEPLARDAVRLCLDPLPGFRVVGEASSGEEAVQAIRSERPDILFLDVRMPGIDGFEVLERVGRSPDMAVIFVTAFRRPRGSRLRGGCSGLRGQAVLGSPPDSIGPESCPSPFCPLGCPAGRCHPDAPFAIRQPLHGADPA